MKVFIKSSRRLRNQHRRAGTVDKRKTVDDEYFDVETPLEPLLAPPRLVPMQLLARIGMETFWILK